MIDIDKWGSPVAEQYGIRSIPHLVLYEDGKQTTSGLNAVLGVLQR